MDKYEKLSDTLKTIYGTNPECFENANRLYAIIFDYLAYDRDLMAEIKTVLLDICREFQACKESVTIDFEKLVINVFETQKSKVDQEVCESPEDYYKLACACKTVKGIVDEETYKNNLKKASDLGHCIAMHTVARLLLKGKYFRKDIQASLELFQKCAENGDAYCFYEMAEVYLRELNDKFNHFTYLKKAVNAGVQEAIYDLAMVYYSNGSPQDYSSAAELLKKAVTNGDINSMYQLALCYRYGHGVEKNMTEAMGLLKKAAELGHSKAKEIIGG